MTQNKLILGGTSFLIITVALSYIVNPFNILSVYASDKINLVGSDGGQMILDTPKDGVLSGKVSAPNGAPLSNIPVTIKNIESKRDIISSGVTDEQGEFKIVLIDNVKISDNSQLINSFVISGDDGQYFTPTSDDNISPTIILPLFSLFTY
jgi:hypothetical protein